MSRDTDQPDPLNDAENGTDEPVPELADLREQPRIGFVQRIRRSIDRRRLGSDLTEFSWKGVLAVVVEFLDLAVQLWSGQSTKKKRR